MKHYVFSPALFDGPALFDTNFHEWGPNIVFVVTVLANMWLVHQVANGWAAETQEELWGASLMEDARLARVTQGLQATIRRDS